MKLKSTLVGAVAALATVTLVGCGTATDLSSANTGGALTAANFGATLATAAGKTTSVHINGSATIGGQHVTLSVDEAHGGTSADGVVLAATVSISGQAPVQLRILHGALYVHPNSQLSFLHGTPWIKIDFGDGNQLGSAFGGLAGSLNPAALAKAFESVLTLKELGPATIDTVATTHYRVTVDVSKVTSLLGLPLGSGASSLPKTLTYDAWLDSANRPVMLSMVNPKFSVNLQFSRWGEPVHVVAPPASQVTSLGH